MAQVRVRRVRIDRREDDAAEPLRTPSGRVLPW